MPASVSVGTPANIMKRCTARRARAGKIAGNSTGTRGSRAHRWPVRTDEATKKTVASSVPKRYLSAKTFPAAIKEKAPRRKHHATASAPNAAPATRDVPDAHSDGNLFDGDVQRRHPRQEILRRLGSAFQRQGSHRLEDAPEEPGQVARRGGHPRLQRHRDEPPLQR